MAPIFAAEPDRADIVLPAAEGMLRKLARVRVTSGACQPDRFPENQVVVQTSLSSILRYHVADAGEYPSVLG
jgi:hypothetical protein